MGLRLISPNGSNIGECRSVRVNGLPGLGGYYLVISLDFSVGQIVELTRLKQLRILVETSEGVRGRIGWGELDGQRTHLLHEHTDHLAVTFLMKLTPLEMVELEKVREGGDITFGVWLSGECTQAGQMVEIREHSTYVVQQGMWLTALDEMGYQKTLTFELRFPAAQQGIADSVFSLLKAARIQLARGDYSECVTNCRKVIEAVNDGTTASRDALKEFKNDAKSMALTERMLVLAESARHAMHLAAHNSETRGEYGYREAKILLAITVALVSDIQIEVAD